MSARSRRSSAVSHPCRRSGTTVQLTHDTTDFVSVPCRGASSQGAGTSVPPVIAHACRMASIDGVAVLYADDDMCDEYLDRYRW